MADKEYIKPAGVYKVQTFGTTHESLKGENLKWQKHVNDTIETKLYSGLHFISAVEGFYATDLEMPIFDKNGTFVGTVSLLLNNSQFFGRVLAPFQPGRKLQDMGEQGR